MKKTFTLLTAVLLTATLWAQSPEKMSYQAVIRNSSDQLVTDTQIGMQISILQGSVDGTVVYTETQTPTTNANGLVSIEIGGGAGFSTIDWASGTYFIKTETDPEGGSDYTITGTSQLLSVPYALHSKTAETVTGGITETDPVFADWDKSTGISITESQISDLYHFTNADETDPIFGASIASGITGTDTTYWNNKLDSYTETDPVFGAWDKSTGISITESQISDLYHFTNADETDPVFGASVASGITGADTTNWNNKLDSYTETDPVFGAWDKSTGISITESQISDLYHFTNADETDPVFGASVASGITGTDTTNWNNKLDSYTETDPVFGAWNKSTGISITESQISDLYHFNNADETDPVFGSSVASGITGTDTTNWNNKLDSYTETDPVFGAWNKSTGISITESQISDLGTYFETETDPTVVANFDFTDAANGDLLQFNGTKWVKVTPDYISDYTVTETDVTAHEAALTVTESQISDLGTYLETETDPAVAANFDFTDAGNGDLLQFNGTKWIKVTPDYISDYTVTEGDVTTHQTALNITESQISDLDHFTTADETDPSVPSGTQTGEMQYWDGSEWITVAPGTTGQVLTFVSGVPTWKATESNIDVTNPITGEIWMDRNLGASQVATSSTDASAYGDLYQWGRAADGHESRTSGTTSTLSSSDTPGHGDFITAGSGSDYDWRSPQNDNLWQGVSGTNNPCPSGYRLPTEAEWEAELASWSSEDAAGAYDSPLKLPMAGYRYLSNGSLFLVGSLGYYWSSTVDGTNSRFLYFVSSNAFMYSFSRAHGLSVRCLKH